MPDATPSQLGRYEIQAILGKGSMGVVYLARDPLIGRLVALKTFHPNLSGDDREMERFRARFLREAQSAGILSHPNIVTIHDVVEESAEGATFIAMEYVQGTNLKEVLRFGKALELAEVVEVLGQIAAALDYAHARGVVHRDVKPANVLLTPERQVKLTDFGIARFEASNLTHDGQLLGTPNYMSPEQVQGREVDWRTDLFSLGVILYEMITRHKPFAADNLTAVTHRIVYKPHTPLERYVGGLPEGLAAILDRALDKDPARRYQNAGDLARDLEQELALHEEQVALSETQNIEDLAVPPPAPQRPGAAGGSGAGAARPGIHGDPPAPTPPPPVVPSPPPAAPSGPATVRPPATGSGGGDGDARPGAGSDGVVDWRRLALVGAAVVIAFLAGGLWWISASGPDLAEVVEATPEERLEVQYRALLREGLRHNQAGDPAAAAAAFRRAESLKPDELRVQRLRRVAEQHAAALQMDELRRRQLALRLEAARAALEAGRFQEALSTATAVIEEDAGNEAAAAVVAEARRALEQARRREARTPPPELREPSAGTAPAEAEAGETAAAGPAALTVVLETEGEGRLRVTVDGRLMADVGYQHFERVGLFRRKRAYRGVTRIPDLEVEAGRHEVRYELTPDGGPPQGDALEVEFPGGEMRTLKLVHVPGTTLAAVVE